MISMHARRKDLRILTHKHTTCRDIGRRSPLTPPDRIPCTIVEGSKDELRGLMSGCFSKKCYREA